MPSKTELANAIRALSMDAVQQANSGHPGAPMGLADVAEVLWNDFLKHNPANPGWANRDRFILSNGHGSMLLYSLLHLTGYDVSIDDLKAFRQLHSKTPGHPEIDETPGVETTTGPLGQGIANAVGMAIAEQRQAAEFNRPNFNIVDHYTYVIVGDGCLMEGISHEVCSLAGTLGLGKLIVLYDSNQISIDGRIEGWFKDDSVKRFEAYGWHVVDAVDGHNPDAIKPAIEQAQQVTDKPSLICCNTVIGYGSPNKAGSQTAHGAPLGEEEIKLAKEKLNWQHGPFEIPEDHKAAWCAKTAGADNEQAWQTLFNEYQQAHPALAAEFLRRQTNQLPQNWKNITQEIIGTFDQSDKAVATRKASLQCIEALAPHLPEFIGGSADLTESNLTFWTGSQALTNQDHSGNYIYYGVREFGMSAIMNGLAIYGGFIPYGGTFLTFSDYARNAVRMAALMKQRSIFVYTHDSIGLGEDGPTHQSVEHVASLRLIPNLSVWRPADLAETAVAWITAIENQNKPTCLILSRQNIENLTSIRHAATADIKKGGYVFFEPQGDIDALIIATGSELPLAIKAAQNSEKNIRVVSIPSIDTFEQQDRDYQQSVLPDNITCRMAIEAGVSDSWYKYVGTSGVIIGVNDFGASAPGNVMFEHFGFTEANITNQLNTLLKQS